MRHAMPATRPYLVRRYARLTGLDYASAERRMKGVSDDDARRVIERAEWLIASAPRHRKPGVALS